MRPVADWRRIAALYTDGSLTLKQIARLTGLSVGTIAKRARREGWPARIRSPSQRHAGATFRMLLTRVLRVVDLQMREIERRLDAAEPSGLAAADLERDARSIASLIRTLEKLKALQRETAAEAARGQGEGAGTDAQRTELERRLAGLLAAAGEAGIPEQPE